jgi:hypothetical protein
VIHAQVQGPLAREASFLPQSLGLGDADLGQVPHLFLGPSRHSSCPHDPLQAHLCYKRYMHPVSSAISEIYMDRLFCKSPWFSQGQWPGRGRASPSQCHFCSTLQVNKTRSPTQALLEVWLGWESHHPWGPFQSYSGWTSEWSSKMTTVSSPSPL